jgi:hypothetical protein
MTDVMKPELGIRDGDIVFEREHEGAARIGLRNAHGEGRDPKAMLAQSVRKSLDVQIAGIGRRTKLGRRVMELEIGELLVADLNRPVGADEGAERNRKRGRHREDGRRCAKKDPSCHPLVSFKKRAVQSLMSDPLPHAVLPWAGPFRITGGKKKQNTGPVTSIRKALLN